MDRNDFIKKAKADLRECNDGGLFYYYFMFDALTKTGRPFFDRGYFNKDILPTVIKMKPYIFKSIVDHCISKTINIIEEDGNSSFTATFKRLLFNYLTKFDNKSWEVNSERDEPDYLTDKFLDDYPELAEFQDSIFDRIDLPHLAYNNVCQLRLLKESLLKKSIAQEAIEG